MSDVTTITGLRTLGPRLLFAALATLLVVIATGIGLARLLPSHPTPQPAVAEQTPPVAPIEKPLEHSPPPRIEEKPLLPLLDKPPALPTLPSEPAKTQPTLPAKTKPLDPAPTDKGQLDLQVGEDFFQELVISRVSRYRIGELDLGQNVQYVLVSRFRVKKKTEQGGAVVEQKVESVRLSNADPVLQERLNALLLKTKGATFTMTLDAKRTITQFEGGPKGLDVIAGDNPLGGASFLVWSFLDRDGWKEMAQLSFFQPPGMVKRGDKWRRPMTHNWGPLGKWSGEVHYQVSGKQAGMERIDYALDLKYQPPKKGGELPFTIGKAEFQIQTARGAIAYNPERGRVAAAEERFHVRGVLAISCLGIDALVQMDEMQLFQLRLVDKNPLDK